MNFSTFCFLARKQLRKGGLDVTHAQTLELGSALLGYRTHAALKTDSDGNDKLTEAAYVILQPQELTRRMGELGFDTALARACTEAFAAALEELVQTDGGTCRIHRSMTDFEEFIFEDVQERAFMDDEVLNAYAGTNAAVDEFYVDGCEYEPLLHSNEEWGLKASGTHTGELDKDRPYSGHSGDFVASYRFAKDGRCGLSEPEVEFSLDFSRDFT